MKAKVIIPKGYREVRSQERIKSSDRYLEVDNRNLTWENDPDLSPSTPLLFGIIVIRRVSRSSRAK